MKGTWVRLGALIAGLALALGVSQGGLAGVAQEQGTSRDPQSEAASSPDAPLDAAIPIQGRLADASGNPLPDGDYTISFRLYSDEVGGDPRCEDTQLLAVSGGLFSALMHNCSRFTFMGDQLWLGIEVEGDGEMIPRQKIAPVPYAWSLKHGARIIGDLSGEGLFVLNSSNWVGSSAIEGYCNAASGTQSGVVGRSDSSEGRGVIGWAGGYGGYFKGMREGSVGLYALAGDDATADIELGSNDDTINGDNGRISSTEYDSSDLYLTSNDDVYVELDDDGDGDGKFQVQSSGVSVLSVEESGRATLTKNAGPSTAIDFGDRFRDNAVVAWAQINSNGTIAWEFGVASVTRASAGNYIIELDAETTGIYSYVPIAIAEVESAPNSAAEVRILSINQTAVSIFRVYITNGNWELVDNQFVFMVTGR